MSSVIQLASQIVNDDPSRISPLFTLIAKVSEHPKDPLKAAHRRELLQWLLAKTEKFEELYESELSAAEKIEDEADDPALLGGPPH